MARSPRDRLVTLLLAVAAALWLAPLAWMLAKSLEGSNQALLERPFALPARPSLAAWERALAEGRMGSHLANSLLVTGLTVTLVVLLGSWAGHGLSKQDLPGRRALVVLFALGMALPVESYLIPLGGLLAALGLHDSLWALILPYTAQALPLAVLLFAAWFAGLPRELEEAAILDGVSTLRFHLTILLPVSRPAVATVAVLTALAAWNELLLALLYVQDPARKTLPAGMVAFQQAHTTDYPALLAGLSIISIPSLIAYLLFNRQVVRGVAEGAVK